MAHTIRFTCTECDEKFEWRADMLKVIPNKIVDAPTVCTPCGLRKLGVAFDKEREIYVALQ